MNLNDAKLKQIETGGRIIREPNQRGMIDVWFTVGENNKLMVNTYEFRSKPNPSAFKAELEAYTLTREATFQTSSHEDWIVI